MKRFIQFSVCLLTIFSFSTVALSQKKSPHKRNKHVSIQLETSFSVHQYKEATSDLEELDSVSTSSTDYPNILKLSDKDKWGGDLGIDMNVSILTRLFRITPGLSIILPMTSQYNTIVNLKDDTGGKSLKVSQENTIGIMIPFKFGFRIKFESFEISPYLGLAGAVYYANIDIDQTNVFTSNETNSAKLTITQSVTVANLGIQFIFFPNSVFGFHIGLELGYNDASTGDDLDFEWKDDYGITDEKVTKESIKHVLPVTSGVYFKPSIGIAFNI